jgi:hypothetical protein
MKLNTIYFADVCDFLHSLPEKSIDLAVVDPPYNMNKGQWDKFKSEEHYFSFMMSWIDLLIPKLKDTASVYLFNNAYNSAILINMLRNKLVFRNWITWYKKDGFSSTKRRYVNMQETILFYTRSVNYTFNSDDIRVPYASTERIANATKNGIFLNGAGRIGTISNCKISGGNIGINAYLANLWHISLDIKESEISGGTGSGIDIWDEGATNTGSTVTFNYDAVSKFVGGAHNIKVTLQEEVACTINGVKQEAPCTFYK